MINPHSWFHIDVKGPDGQVVDLDDRRREPEPAHPHGRDEEHRARRHPARRRGLSAKDGTNKAVGRDFMFPDGRRCSSAGRRREPQGER